MANIRILGGGLVGNAMARNLSKVHRVAVIELDPDKISKLKQYDIATSNGNCLDKDQLNKFIADADLVIGALPGYLGYQVLEKVIRMKRNVVDISFFPEDPFTLSKLAEENGVTAIVDAGVAPGLCNLMLGHHLASQEVTSYQCLVGGLPVKRTWPFQYKAVFSPADVIEEYIRPVKVRLNGHELIKQPLSEPEIVDFEQTGSLESFLTDGLRTLLTTTQVPELIEKTLRYPGSTDYLRMLQKSGFLDQEKDPDTGISPLQFTSRILKKEWQLEPGEPDLTIMRVSIKGDKNVVYTLFDQYDPVNDVLSMSRCTGYTCCGIAELLLANKIDRKGILAPEQIGMIPGIYDFIFQYLSKRNVKISYAEVS